MSLERASNPEQENLEYCSPFIKPGTENANFISLQQYPSAMPNWFTELQNSKSEKPNFSVKQNSDTINSQTKDEMAWPEHLKKFKENTHVLN